MQLLFLIRIYFHQKWFSSNGECNFDNPTKNFSPKNHRFVTQVPKKEDRNYQFFGREILFPQIVLLHMRNPFVTTASKICRQRSQNFLLEFQTGWKTCALPKQSFFSPKSSFEHAQLNFGKPAVTFLPRIRQTFPNSKNVEVAIFQQNSFFHQKRLFSNGECNFDNASKKISLRIHRSAAQIPKTTKNVMIFSKGK